MNKLTINNYSELTCCADYVVNSSATGFINSYGNSDFTLPINQVRVPNVWQEQRCIYCGVKALPDDRWCEGCGAPL